MLAVPASTVACQVVDGRSAEQQMVRDRERVGKPRRRSSFGRLRPYVRAQLAFGPRQYAMYLAGLLLFSLGAKGFIDAGLGTDPLDVLQIALADWHGRGVGLSAVLVSVVFLTWWTAWNRSVPPVTPFVSTVAVGYLIDLWNHLELEAYTVEAVAARPVTLAGATFDAVPVVLDVVALLLCAYASALIIMSGIGIRIMDLVALTMMQRWGWSFFAAKMSLEVLLFTTGALLGGPLGFTTIAFLFLVGPFIQPFMWANRRYLRLPNHSMALLREPAAA